MSREKIKASLLNIDNVLYSDRAELKLASTHPLFIEVARAIRAHRPDYDTGDVSRRCAEAFEARETTSPAAVRYGDFAAAYAEAFEFWRDPLFVVMDVFPDGSCYYHAILFLVSDKYRGLARDYYIHQMWVRYVAVTGAVPDPADYQRTAAYELALKAYVKNFRVTLARNYTKEFYRRTLAVRNNVFAAVETFDETVVTEEDLEDIVEQYSITVSAEEPGLLSQAAGGNVPYVDTERLVDLNAVEQDPYAGYRSVADSFDSGVATFAQLRDNIANPRAWASLYTHEFVAESVNANVIVIGNAVARPNDQVITDHRPIAYANPRFDPTRNTIVLYGNGTHYQAVYLYVYGESFYSVAKLVELDELPLLKTDDAELASPLELWEDLDQQVRDKARLVTQEVVAELHRAFDVRES